MCTVGLRQRIHRTVAEPRERARGKGRNAAYVADAHPKGQTLNALAAPRVRPAERPAATGQKLIVARPKGDGGPPADD